MNNVFEVLYDELLGFSGLGPLLDMYHKGDYSPLLTLTGVLSAMSPVIPLLLLIEIVRVRLFWCLHSRYAAGENRKFYRYVFWGVYLSGAGFCAGAGVEE